MARVAIVGIFFDGYYDLWEDFLELFEKNWKGCPYPLYIVDNEKELNYNKKYNAKVLHAGKDAEYSRKVQLAVNSIDADYYLLLLEDFFIGEPLKKDCLNRLLNVIEQKHIKYYRMPMPEFTPFRLKGKRIKIHPQMEYTVSCQPSIWKREFLKECIGAENYNAWIFEGIYTKSRKAHTVDFLRGCYSDYTNILHLYHGALQGKMLPRTYSHFVKSGYTFKNQRKILSSGQEFKDHLKNQLKGLIPVKVQRFIKECQNNNSIVEKYSSKVERLIASMNLN